MFGDGFDDANISGGPGKLIQSELQIRNKRGSHDLGNNFQDKKGVIPRCISEMFE